MARKTTKRVKRNNASNRRKKEVQPSLVELNARARREATERREKAEETGVAYDIRTRHSRHRQTVPLKPLTAGNKK